MAEYGSFPSYQVAFDSGVEGDEDRFTLENAVTGDRGLVVSEDPGGLLEATRQIVQAVLNSAVPVVVYISPSGARGASAGTFCGADDGLCGDGGSCDACPVRGGVTTEDEMFLMLGSFYVVP